jgi:catechol 2,3-dioxygenase-like lactoylglutathione lyase family enzyme
MELEMRRIIIFTSDVAAMARFYRDVIGLELVADEKDWKELKAGACNLAFHRGKSAIGDRPPKIAFYAADVAAARAALVKRGATMGKVKSGRSVDLCDGKDPDGNPFQISSRR